MPARRGKKIDGGLASVMTDRPSLTDGPQVYVCGARPLNYRHWVLTEGVEVPGAASWPRIEAWERARAVRRISAEQPFIPFTDFIAAHPLAPVTDPQPAPMPKGYVEPELVSQE